MTAEPATVEIDRSREAGERGRQSETASSGPRAAAGAPGRREPRFFIVEDGGKDAPDPRSDDGRRPGLSVEVPVVMGSTVRQLRPGCGSRWKSALAAALRRSFDVLAASALLLLLAPLMAAIAVAIRLDTPGPILYRQTRVGRSRRKGGRGSPGRSDDGADREFEEALTTFTLYKFRSMCVDAEEDTGAVWARENDDRVTSVGRWLRRLRLDELPQLFNVLRGDMALVGPRPERPEFVLDLAEEVPQYTHRLLVPPGITGLAQVSQEADRSVEDVGRKIRYDLEYLRRRSLRLDLRILLQTPFVVLARTLAQSPFPDGWPAGDRRPAPRPTGTT